MRMIAFAMLVMTLPISAQDSGAPVSLRLRVVDEVKVGRAAPQFVLPYATAAGPGPVDQPFDLAKELGRVVVLAFYPGDFTPGCTAQWRAFRDRADAIFGSEVVVVGISSDSLTSHVRFAAEHDLPFKLLSDPGLRVASRYGATDGRRMRRVVVVIGRDGIVRHVDNGFAALDPQSYVNLGEAVKAARQSR